MAFTLNVAVVDDLPDEVDALGKLVERYCRKRGYEVTLNKFNDSIRFIANYKSVYDLVFLDIDMPDMNGMDVARNLRRIDAEVSLVFVTNLAKHAICGYEVDADDFIVKPVRYENLELKLDRILRKHRVKDKPYVTVYDDGLLKYVPISNVRYVEVIKHSIIYHMTDGNYEKRGSLKAEAQLFEENGFAQCNKSVLVNLRYVLGITGYTLHVAKKKGSLEYEELSIGHPRKKEFLRALNKYLEENL